MAMRLANPVKSHFSSQIGTYWCYSGLVTCFDGRRYPGKTQIRIKYAAGLIVI